MFSLPHRTSAARFFLWLTAALLLCLSVSVLPVAAKRAEPRMSPDIQMTEPVSEGEETPRKGSPVTDGALGRSGNLGDTDGDGRIEGETRPAEQDPMHAVQNMSQRYGGWITTALCIIIAISLILIIVAMIPKKHK